jgi:hypothetical protein
MAARRIVWLKQLPEQRRIPDAMAGRASTNRSNSERLSIKSRACSMTRAPARY